MSNALKLWWKRYFSDKQVFPLLAIALLLTFVITVFGSILAPLFASIIIAYILDAAVQQLEKIKVTHHIAVLIVFITFLGLFVLSFIALVPLLSKQIANFVNEIPSITEKMNALPDKIHNLLPFISDDQSAQILASIKSKLTNLGNFLLKGSLSFLPGMVSFILYLVMIPLLVYFFLMDKMKIIHWFQRNIIPSHSLALKKMGWEVDKKIGNYLRGRALEFLIVTVVTTITFWIFHLQYAFLLAVLVGISVFIPYIGIIIATLPAFALAIIQFGFSDKLLYLSIAYSAIVLLDANVLVPLLFSEAVDLHPTVIILSVLLFGGLWQFWGMFFAIPLAILIAAIFKHWPTASVNDY